MHRGPAGAGVLNERLQAALTPGREGLAERRFGGRVYRVGDKVMQLRNNYDKGTAGVFNGSVGQVTALSLEDSELRVVLDEDEEVAYGFDELDELTHAYAVSIHRSQGSEYPCVVIPLTTSAWLMLQRNLLYTAVTRAKQMVVLVGSPTRPGQGGPDPGRRPPLHRPHSAAAAGRSRRHGRSQLSRGLPAASSHCLWVGRPAPASSGR
jgi:exodeoxyribonuclease V alpha subunit